MELWSATHWLPDGKSCGPRRTGLHCSHKLIDDFEQLEDPAQRGHFLTGVGARQRAVGNARVATPGSVSSLDTAGVLRKGADPRTALEKQIQKLCSCLRVLLLPPASVGVLFLVLFAWSRFLLCQGCVFFSWFPSVGADPENGHLRRKPPSTYAVTEYVATYIGGNAWMPIVLCTIQFLSAFSPSSILASASWAFHQPSRERKRYYSLWSSDFPVPSARRGITSCSRLRPNARRHSSSRQPHLFVYLAMAVAAAVRDRRCGVFRHADSLGLSSS